MSPQTNNENSTATSVRCSIQNAASLISSRSMPRPAGPMAMPRTRHTAEVVTGIQRRYDEVSARVSNTAPNTATQATKLMAQIPKQPSVQGYRLLSIEGLHRFNYYLQE
ncbi:hypothetical protein D9M69_508470 [compost metagenome]